MKHHLKRSSVGLVCLVAALCGCSAMIQPEEEPYTTHNTADVDYLRQYPERSRDIKLAIAYGNVMLGMSMQETLISEKIEPYGDQPLNAVLFCDRARVTECLERCRECLGILSLRSGDVAYLIGRGAMPIVRNIGVSDLEREMMITPVPDYEAVVALSTLKPEQRATPNEIRHLFPSWNWQEKPCEPIDVMECGLDCDACRTVMQGSNPRSFVPVKLFFIEIAGILRLFRIQ